MANRIIQVEIPEHITIAQLVAALEPLGLRIAFHPDQPPLANTTRKRRQWPPFNPKEVRR